MIEIDLPRAVELVLGEIAKEAPGFKYLDTPVFCGKYYECVNVDKFDGTWVPLCLIGRALVSAGVDVEDFRGGAIAMAAWNTTSRVLQDCGVINVTSSASEYFREAQCQQDDGKSWSAAHSAALQRVLRSGYFMTDAEKAWLQVR